MTKRIMVRDIAVGGGAPITIQSMTNTDTADAEATIAQIKRLEAAGCEIVRSSVYNMDCARAIPRIMAGIDIPLVADIHFDHRLAIAAMENGVDKVRFNPGNIGSEAKVRELVDCAKSHHTPIRIGVNGGSLEKDIKEKYGYGTADAMVESAMRHVRILEKCGFYDIVISIKSSNVAETVHGFEKLSKLTDYPLHIGVTEAGTDAMGVAKSDIGIGALLLQGIGDTLRVSLTGDPVREVEAGLRILRATGIRRTGADVVSCPTCGRCSTDLYSVVHRVEDALSHSKGYIKVAVMGCAVNGPGEASDADIGIAFGLTNAVVFRDGEKQFSAEKEEAITRFIAEAQEMQKRNE